MKVSEIIHKAESSDLMEEQFFSIENNGMIFDILRNKMYSNPIAAVCREIACNARDAHREVNKANEPIVIHLPNISEPYFKVKDYGPGISPDRISNIFIKYAASTKRADNIQTGGFGLGAKTPFAYSDSFNIETIVDGKKYNYICFIDESKIGKISLVLEEDTSEPNGTEIIIPVTSNDFREFIVYTELATRYWQVKPLIKGGAITYRKVENLIAGLDWKVASTQDWTRGVKLIIDEIEYPLDTDAFKGDFDLSLIESCRGTMFIYFGVGELSLSANREQIYLDKPTKAKIATRVEKIALEIKDSISKEIKSAKYLNDAYTIYKNKLSAAFYTLNFMGNVLWNDIPVNGDSIHLGCLVNSFIKGYTTYYRGSSTRQNKIRRSTGRYLYFDSTTVIVINDLGLKEVTSKHIKKYFESLSNVEKIQVINPTSNVTIESLNKDHHINLMNTVPLSSITKSSNRSTKSSGERLLVYKLDMSSASFKQVSYQSMLEDPKQKVLCYLQKGLYSDKSILMDNGKVLSEDGIRSLVNIRENISFYGVDSGLSSDKIESNFASFKSLSKFMEEITSVKTKDEYIKERALFELKKLINVNEANIIPINLIKDQNSLFLRLSKLTNKILDEAEFSVELQIYQFLNGKILDIDSFLEENPEYDIKSLTEKVKEKYPLINFIKPYEVDFKIQQHIAEYINLVDSFPV